MWDWNICSITNVNEYTFKELFNAYIKFCFHKDVFFLNYVTILLTTKVLFAIVDISVRHQKLMNTDVYTHDTNLHALSLK